VRPLSIIQTDVLLDLFTLGTSKTVIRCRRHFARGFKHAQLKDDEMIGLAA
jgi:hypothetical protein